MMKPTTRGARDDEEEDNEWMEEMEGCEQQEEVSASKQLQQQK